MAIVFEGGSCWATFVFGPKSGGKENPNSMPLSLNYGNLRVPPQCQPPQEIRPY